MLLHQLDDLFENILSLNYWDAKPQKAMKPDIILFEDLRIKAPIPLEKMLLLC